MSHTGPTSLGDEFPTEGVRRPDDLRRAEALTVPVSASARPTVPMGMASAGAPTEPDEMIVIGSSKPAWAVAILAIIAGLAAFGLTFYDRSKKIEALEAAEAARVAALADVANARADAAEKGTRVKGLEEELAALRADNAAKEEELARIQATQKELEERVSSEIITGDITLTRDGSRLSVQLVDKMLFDSGQADLNERGKEVLLRLAAVLEKVEDRSIQIVGHTDDAPPTEKIRDRFPTNWELSVTRATNVVRFLSEEGKVPGKRLVAVGKGQFEPVATNANPKGRARNRRIEILLTPIVVGAKTAAEKR